MLWTGHHLTHPNKTGSAIFTYADLEGLQGARIHWTTQRGVALLLSGFRAWTVASSAAEVLANHQPNELHTGHLFTAEVPELLMKWERDRGETQFTYKSMERLWR